MPIATRSSLAVGLEALRSNPLRTALSTLGVVMGVAAMVSVLSLGDGVEAFNRAQIEQTTDLLAISIAPVLTASIDGQQVRREDAVVFTRADAQALGGAVRGARSLQLVTSGASLVELVPGAPARGFGVIGALSSYFTEAGMRVDAGRTFTDGDSGVVVLERRAAVVVAGDSASPERAVGKSIRLNGHPHSVIGVVSGGRGGPSLTAFVPVSAAARAIPGARAPSIVLVAGAIEAVDPIRGEAERWAAVRYGPRWKERVTVGTNRQRVEQVATAMLILKLLMGAVTGISLLVGGIGIMNVLLASVAERTREIGVRKSIGARGRDVLVQFLAESVVITGVGATAGVALGLGIAFGVAAIMRAKTSAPVYAAVTPSTILVAASLSVLIGITFGLYPALRAAQLSPIDAIRKE